DFEQIPRFLDKLREGYDLVQGCRLPAGGGTVLSGAMPFLHRWGGNPLFSLITRRWFHAPIHDVYCGMRAFRRDAYERLDQQCTGMEFATEMIVNASLSILCGYQAILFSIFTKMFAIGDGLMPEDPQFDRLFDFVNLERGLVV